MSLNNWIRYIQESFKKPVCEGCGVQLENDFTASFHEWKCISGIIGYDFTEEKFAPSSRVYFFTEKQKAR